MNDLRLRALRPSTPCPVKQGLWTGVDPDQTCRLEVDHGHQCHILYSGPGIFTGSVEGAATWNDQRTTLYISNEVSILF